VRGSLDWDCFKDFLRRIAAVPKAEVDAKMAEHKALGGHLKTGQSWTGQNRPVGEPPQARVF
jgi:hypothetical protein